MTVKEFLKKYYKPSRSTGRGEEYAESLLKFKMDHFNKYDYTIISKFSSITGTIVCLDINGNIFDHIPKKYFKNKRNDMIY